MRCADRTRLTSPTFVGGAKKHGETNFTLEADVPYTIVDTAHPIMQGMTNFSIKDEAFYSMTWAKSPEVHVLATAVIAATPSAQRAGHAGEVVPQIWTYENQLTPAPTGQPFRAFVWMQGHFYAELLEPADSADAASRHRVGGASIGGHADDRAPRPRRPGAAHQLVN